MRSNRRVGYTFTYLDDDVVPNLEFEDFDITDHDLFLTTAANSVYARNRFVPDRRDRIWAGRLDVERELDGFITRSDARSVGKECVRPGRSRWSPDHYKIKSKMV